MHNPFGLPLSRRTLEDLASLGVATWDGLCALSDRDRKMLYGWGRLTERRFQERLAESRKPVNDNG